VVYGRVAPRVSGRLNRKISATTAKPAEHPRSEAECGTGSGRPRVPSPQSIPAPPRDGDAGGSNQMNSARSRSSADFGFAPTISFTTCPSLKTLMVGIFMIP
jgi:hypothetical protein